MLSGWSMAYHAHSWITSDYFRSLDMVSPRLGKSRKKHKDSKVSSDQLALVGCFTYNYGILFTAVEYGHCKDPIGFLYEPISIAECHHPFGTLTR